MITHDGTGWLFADEKGRRYRYAPIRIGSRSFIGARATLLPGVDVGADCVVAAGAVVSRSVPAGVVVAGNPARIIGDTAKLRTRVLSHWMPESARRGSDYREMVDSIADSSFAPLMTRG
ncbi:acyltransferase [Microbacterium atlanticum]|uniref:acyltransferase n=1 Tax=Microbacterium atlanticum TaxID=2782168 RepID=UPI003B5873BC